MKKLLILLVLAATAACNTEDDNPNKTSAVYTGMLTVTSNATPDAEPFEMTDVSFETTHNEDGEFVLTMHDIRFAASMPRPLTIVIPSLLYGDAAGDGIDAIYSTVDPVVPYIGGKPFSVFEILGFKGSYPNSGTRLSIEFTCKNPTINVNGEPLDHRAVFDGALTNTYN